MTEKEIKKLNRRDLLILLAEQRDRADRLEKDLKEAKERLEDRHLAQEECGTMAEAALKLNAVFQAADEAVAQYVENIYLLQGRQEAICQDMESASRKKSEEILHSAEEFAEQKRRAAEQIVRDAQEQAKEIILQAEAEIRHKKLEAEKMVSQAKETAQQVKLQTEEMIRQAQEQVTREMKKIDSGWSEIYQRIHGMQKDFSFLQDIINQNAGE